MSGYLVFLFLLTILFIVFFSLPGSRRPDGAKVGKLVTAVFLLLTTLTLLAAIVMHLQLPGDTVAASVRHIEFRGVDVTLSNVDSDVSNIRITGDAIDAESDVKRGFRWFALSNGAWIDLLPLETSGKKILAYRAVARHEPQVIRLNRQCINQTLGGWAALSAKPRYRIERTSRDRKKKTEAFEFTLEIKEDQVRVVTDLDGSNTIETELRNRLSLRDLLQSSHAVKLAVALAPFTTTDGQPVVDRLMVIRQIQGEGKSAVGIIGADLTDSPKRVDPESGGTPDFDLSITRADGTADEIAPSIKANDSGFRLDAFDGAARSTLTLASTAEPTQDSHVRLRFEFNPPRAYPLPPSNLLKELGGAVRLASVDMGQPMDGYIFDTGNLNEAYVASAKIDPAGKSMSVSSGATDKAEDVQANTPTPLATGAVVPVYALADPLKNTGMPWLIPAAGLVGGMFLCIAAFTRLPGKRRTQLPRNIASSSAAFVLWAGAATLLTVRLILAYRVSVLPPFNMDTAAAESYRDCWPKAVGAMVILLPALGLLTLLVVRFKERGAVPPAALKFGDYLQKTLPKIARRPYQSLGRASFILAFVFAFMNALHKKFSFIPFPDAVLMSVLLLILGIVLEGVGDVRDEAIAENNPEPPSAKDRVQSIAAKLPDNVTAKISQAKEYVEKRPLLKRVVDWLSDFSRNRLLWLTAFLLLYVDAGTFLFILPFCLAICIGFVSTSLGRGNAGASSLAAKGVFIGLLVFFLIGLKMAAPFGGQLLTGSFLGKLAKGSAISYRMAATNPEYAESLMLDPATNSGNFEPRNMQRTLHQRWQMKSYVKGAGAGYFGAPLSSVGMTYPTMLSDAAFSVLLVGEHGKLTAALVIGFLLLMSFVVFRAAWAAAISRNQRANVRGLYAIAGMLGASGVYMALANLWVVPFTGQNVPLLSLNSTKDLILNGCLLAAAILLLAFPGGFSTQIDPAAAKDAKRVRWLWWSFPALLVAGWLYLGASLASSGGDPKDPFNLSKPTLDGLQQVVDSANEKARREQVAITEVDSIKKGAPFVRNALTSFVNGEVTETPIAEGRGSSSRLVVDRRFFRLSSPFEVDTGVAWHGSLVAQGAVKRHQLFVGGSRVPVILERNRGPAELMLGRRVKPIIAQAIDLRQGTTDYGGLKMVGDKVMFRWRSSGKPGTILVNGKRPNLPLNEVTLNPGDVVSLEYAGDDGVSEKMTITYPGPMEAMLSTVSWRNGKYRRSFPQGADFPLAYTISQVGDENVRYGKKKLEDVQLSLDLGLQRELQNKIRGWARSQGRLTDTGSRLPDGLPFTTVAIIDSFSGQIRALAGLPQRDPSESFESVRKLFPSERDALLASRSSWAFANRTIGSSVKPISFAALSTQLKGSIDLSQLHVNEAAAVESYTDEDGEQRRAYRQLGDIHLPRGRNLSGRENPRSDVSMYDYLKDSRTWPAVVTATIGLVADRNDPQRQKAELSRMLAPGSGFVTLGGQSKGFFPSNALGRIFVKGLNLNSVELADTAYFKGLQNCYGPNVVPFNVNESAPWDDVAAKAFLSPLDVTKVQSSELKRLGLPDLHRADTTVMTKFDLELVKYMIGGGESRWNALTMAVNGARIMTGKMVSATFDAKAGTATKEMPDPIKNISWRQAHILGPLENITTLGSDGATIRQLASSGGFTIAMKTGTIDDGMGNLARESEMLLFTIGRYNAGSGFVPGQSISGFLSIRSSKLSNGPNPIVKGDLMKLLMPTLTKYLQTHQSKPKKP